MAESIRNAVQLSGESKSFANLEIIQGLDVVVRKREVVSFVGPSGCGKSTTLRIIANLEKIEGGNIERGFKKPAFIFQEPRLLPWRDAFDNVCFVIKDSLIDPNERSRIV